MKKLFFIAAITGAALVSCTKNELAPSLTEQNEISFAAPVVGVQTKGTALNGTTFPAGRDFKVYAEWFSGNYTASAGTSYIPGVVCTKGEGKNYWSPSVPYYWPTGSNAGTLTFAAFSPATVDGSYDFENGTGIQFTDYVVTTEVANQVDLLFSERTYNKTYSATDEDHNANHIYNGVDLCFRHALCDINFLAKTKDDYGTNTIITIKQVDLMNVATKGTFSQGLTDADAAVTVMETQLWTAATDAYATYTVYKDDTGITLSTTSKDLETYGDLMLIPQTMGNTSSPDATIKVRVTYEIKSDATTITTTQDIYLNTTGLGYPTEWFSGKRYNYTIVVGMQEIYFDPAVYDWVESTAADLTF